MLCILYLFGPGFPKSPFWSPFSSPPPAPNPSSLYPPLFIPSHFLLPLSLDSSSLTPILVINCEIRHESYSTHLVSYPNISPLFFLSCPRHTYQSQPSPTTPFSSLHFFSRPVICSLSLLLHHLPFTPHSTSSSLPISIQSIIPLIEE